MTIHTNQTKYPYNCEKVNPDNRHYFILKTIANGSNNFIPSPYICSNFSFLRHPQTVIVHAMTHIMYWLFPQQSTNLLKKEAKQLTSPWLVCQRFESKHIIPKQVMKSDTNNVRCTKRTKVGQESMMRLNSSELSIVIN